MDGDDLKRQLHEVFGGGGQMAPGGTGAVLTRPSKLQMDMATKVVRAMPLDQIFRDLGAVAAREVADQLQQQGLRPADFASLPDLPKVVAKRLVGYLLRSDEFSRSFIKNLKARG